MKTVIGIFDNKEDADHGLDELRDAGYNPKDISILMKNRDNMVENVSSPGTRVGEGAATGATTGAVLGGLAGLLIGIGAISIPGIGAFLIGGPIAAALGITGAAATTAEGAMTGALAGGILGGLTGLGIPRDQAEVYERRVNEGAILVMVPLRRDDQDDVTDILEDNDATDVKTFNLR